MLMTDEVASLANRVDRLERLNRQLKLLALAAALGLMVVALVAAGKPARTIEAQKIVLLDRHGNARLTIGTPAVTGATVDVQPDEPVIWLADDKGADRAMLTAGGLFFANAKAKPTIGLSADSNGRSTLKFYKTDGTVAWSAP